MRMNICFTLPISQADIDIVELLNSYYLPPYMAPASPERPVTRD